MVWEAVKPVCTRDRWLVSRGHWRAGTVAAAEEKGKKRTKVLTHAGQSVSVDARNRFARLGENGREVTGGEREGLVLQFF